MRPRKQERAARTHLRNAAQADEHAGEAFVLALTASSADDLTYWIESAGFWRSYAERELERALQAIDPREAAVAL